MFILYSGPNSQDGFWDETYLSMMDLEYTSIIWTNLKFECTHYIKERSDYYIDFMIIKKACIVCAREFLVFCLNDEVVLLFCIQCKICHLSNETKMS